MCTVSEEEPRTPASMAGRQKEGEPSVTCPSVSGRWAIGSLCLVRYGPQWHRNSQAGDDLTERGGLSLGVRDRRGRPRAGETCEWNWTLKLSLFSEVCVRARRAISRTSTMVPEHSADTVLSYRDSLAVHSCLVRLPKGHTAERLFLNLEETWQADLFHLSFFLVLLLREELWNKICRKQISKWKTPEINCRAGMGDWFRERLTFIIIIIRWT